MGNGTLASQASISTTSDSASVTAAHLESYGCFEAFRSAIHVPLIDPLQPLSLVARTTAPQRLLPVMSAPRTHAVGRIAAIHAPATART